MEVVAMEVEKMEVVEQMRQPRDILEPGCWGQMNNRRSVSGCCIKGQHLQNQRLRSNKQTIKTIKAHETCPSKQVHGS